MRSHCSSANELAQRVPVLASMALAAVVSTVSSLDEAAAVRASATVERQQMPRSGLEQVSLAWHTSRVQAVPSVQLALLLQQAAALYWQRPVAGLQLSTVQNRLSLHTMATLLHTPPVQVSVVQRLLSLHSAF